MDPSLASFLSVGTQSLASGLGGLFTNSAIKKENQKNRDWNEKMWNLTNEYNSPANQRRLYELAGLNPALLYGNNTSALSSYAGNLGTSENFKNPLEGFKTGIQEAVQAYQQNRQVDSNIKVNESVINKNNADAQEALSRVPFYQQQTEYLGKLVTTQDNENIWFDLSLPVRRQILDNQLAYSAGQVDYLVEGTKNLISDRENNKAMVLLKQEAFKEATKQAWAKIDLMEKQVKGQIEAWLMQGDAALRQSKAAMLNAITGGRLADLQYEKFNKFSDKEYDILVESLRTMQENNAWLPLFNEQKYNFGNKQYDFLNTQQKSMQNQLDFYEMNMFLDFTQSILKIF